jgi:hypothetical protein
MSAKFGLCFHCRGSDSCLNIRSHHVVLCDEHKKWWQTTSDSLPQQHETNDKWNSNADKLEAYTKVQAGVQSTHGDLSRPATRTGLMEIEYTIWLWNCLTNDLIEQGVDPIQLPNRIMDTEYSINRYSSREITDDRPTNGG